MAAPPTYTAPPNDPPVLGSPNFAANAQGYLGWFPTFGAYCQALAAWLQAELETGGIYGQENILGAVSQAGGVPTGAIIERGSNANGEYVRFADGTQLCMFAAIINTTVAATTIQEATWTFPAAFASTPDTRVNLRSVNDAANREVAARLFGGCVTVNSSASAVVTAYNGDASSRTVRADVFAFGRWF